MLKFKKSFKIALFISLIVLCLVKGYYWSQYSIIGQPVNFEKSNLKKNNLPTSNNTYRFLKWCQRTSAKHFYISNRYGINKSSYYNFINSHGMPCVEPTKTYIRMNWHLRLLEVETAVDFSVQYQLANDKLMSVKVPDSPQRTIFDPKDVLQLKNSFDYINVNDLPHIVTELNSPAPSSAPAPSPAPSLGVSSTSLNPELRKARVVGLPWSNFSRIMASEIFED